MNNVIEEINERRNIALQFQLKDRFTDVVKELKRVQTERTEKEEKKKKEEANKNKGWGTWLYSFVF